MNNPDIRFVFFGSSSFSEHVLEALESKGLVPVFSVTSARDPLPMEKLKEMNADVFVVASFGKILPKELIYMPKGKTLNVHPSLLPRLRGPAPIQGAILNNEETGVTIMRLNEKMDEGPILAQKKVPFSIWPIPYSQAEAILGRIGGDLLADMIHDWVRGDIKEEVQDSSLATYTKMIKKEDADITNDSPEVALRKILAYEIWPRAFMNYTRKDGKVERIVVTRAHLDTENKLLFDRIIPAGKREMTWEEFMRGNR